EAWQAMGDGLVAEAAWPEVDPALLVEDEVTIVFQVNGKLRDKEQVMKGSSKEVLEQRALANTKVQSVLLGVEPKKVIVVPDRLVNVVV
ncbi:MAG: leucine--tRNA ligase, partial [Sphingomonadaceae bacterium]|nr:leucine--tRNA ligase [Sphingomonadaceae bacterium]